MDQFSFAHKDELLKILHESREETWQFSSLAELKGMIRRPVKPTEIVLLLHGLAERGKRIYRKLIPYLPESALVVAPNAPFPIPRQKEGRLDYGYSWYFYDKVENKYFINQDIAKAWLRDFIKTLHPESLPVTIIGFSQGGYLAPLVGKEIAQTKLVIGIACEFRRSLISSKLPFSLTAILGEDDEIVGIDSALKEIENLKEIGIEVETFKIPQNGHSLSTEVCKKVNFILEKYGKRSL